MTSITTVCRRPAVRFAGRTLYYLLILAGLFLLRGRDAFQSAAFIYQAF